MFKRIATAGVLLAVALAAVGCSGAVSSAPDGAQTIKVTAEGTFVPEASAKAGAPIRLEFGPGSGCTSAIQFAEYGISEDLTDGGGVVDLPALEAGEYPLVCQSNMVMGTLKVK